MKLLKVKTTKKDAENGKLDVSQKRAKSTIGSTSAKMQSKRSSPNSHLVSNLSTWIGLANSRVCSLRRR